MHELSLCNAIFSVVDRSASGRPVATVHLEVGQMRQVVPETLQYCWGLVSADTTLAGSVLAIDHVPILLHCRDCGQDTTPGHKLVLTCAACGSGQVSMTRGEEFMITSLDLKEA